MGESQKTEGGSVLGSKPHPVRLGVLLIILMLVAIGARYDRKARSAWAAAPERLELFNRQMNEDFGHQMITNLDVRQVFGREPSRTIEVDDSDFTEAVIEVYSWTGPLQSYEVFAYYARGKHGDLLLVEHDTHLERLRSTNRKETEATELARLERDKRRHPERYRSGADAQAMLESR